MTKVTSPSGLVSNTNRAREDQVHNINGYDRAYVTYIRFINIGKTPIRDTRGELYDHRGNLIGDPNTLIVQELSPKEHLWKSRDRLSDLVGDTWNGVASLRFLNAHDDIRLINLNLVENEVF